MKTTWWWVRHGPTHADVLAGWTDIPADLSDVSQLSRLSSFLPERAVVISSDLSRASKTADAHCEGPEATARRAGTARDQFRQLGRKAVQPDIAGASVALQKILFRSGKSRAAGRRILGGRIEPGQRVRGSDHGYPGWRAHCRCRAFRHHPHASPARHEAKHPRAVRPQSSKPFRNSAFVFRRFLDHGFIQPSSLKYSLPS